MPAWLPLLATACGPMPPAEPPQANQDYEHRERVAAQLQVNEASVGGVLTATVGWGAPGARVELWGGSRPGAGPCLSLQGSVCLDIEDARLLAEGLAGEDGTARLELPISSRTPPYTKLFLQAMLDGEPARLTRVVSRILTPAGTPPEQTPPGYNVLIVLLDDVGTDKLAAYDSPVPAVTPTIDALARAGVTFDAAYTRPVCVPARAALQTGRMARRTGVGMNWREDDPFELGLEQVTLAELVELSPWFRYETSYVGKWHLSSTATTGFAHPLRQGWDFYAGAFANLFRVDEGFLSYTDWWKVEDGVEVHETRYATSDTIDDAVARIGAMAEPWMLFVSLNAAHTPMELPPPELVPVSSARGRGHIAREMIGAVDTELARLIDAIPPSVRARTTLFLTADNGSNPGQAQEPVSPRRAKGTLFDGGVRVPLIVAGAGVTASGERSSALVDLVDLFPTVARIAGVELEALPALDGHDLSPLLSDPEAAFPRAYAYSELFSPPGQGPYTEADRIMVRDAHYKLIVDRSAESGVFKQFFAYSGRDEGPNLLGCSMTAEQQSAYERLWRELHALADSLVFDAEPFAAPPEDTGGPFSEFPLEKDTAEPDCHP